MGKKRKSVATSLDEVDRTMYSAFCSAANSLSQLYTQATHQQKLTFQAGERHGLEKLYQWILKQQEEGARLNNVDILSYLQTELDYHGEEPSSLSPRAANPNQNHQPLIPMNVPNSSFLVSSGPSPPGQGSRSENSDHQSKNYVFSNALSSPVRRSIQNYQSQNSRASYNHPQLITPNGFRNNDTNLPQNQNRDMNPSNSNDSSMDMHPDDSPSHDTTY
ncbi:uncharacterized protein LOC124945031 [Impatiens glandulifera]|uniref:uncharacterized protein LOC124945031 n=1 Tax=Impatiens glandulifera TaxID=253017 RepID=UPI001FB1727A|nr:uncharacterized protein LOC124945031 [Impatiens glandulifera]